MRLRSALAVGVTPVGYARPMRAARIMALAPRDVYGLIDTHGAEYIELGVTLGVLPERINTIAACEAAGRIGAKTEVARGSARAEVLKEMITLIADGAVEINIAGTYLLDDVQLAYAELEKRHTRGKIVLLPR